MNHQRSRFLIFTSLLAILMGIGFGTPVHAATEGSTETELSSDFSDYVPVEDPDDTYDDESFMYFGKQYGIMLGSGAEVWTGRAGELYGTAIPILDVRFLYFTDTRSALQLGLSVASHKGTVPVYGPSTLSVMKISVDYKYYFGGGQAAYDPATRGWGVSNPNPYITVGINYLDLKFEFPEFNGGSSIRGVEWKAPIVGKMPIPAWPSLAVGMDFALQPRTSSLALEAKYFPLGSRFGSQDILDQVFQTKEMGNLLFLTANVTFAFD